MPGMTLCGDLGEWVGDENLLNCCAEDTNEPVGDDFDTRLRERAEGAWIDPQVGVFGAEERSNILAGDNTDDDDNTDDGGGNTNDEGGDQGLPDIVYPDYCANMTSDKGSSGNGQVGVCSAHRDSSSRYARRARRSGAASWS